MSETAPEREHRPGDVFASEADPTDRYVYRRGAEMHGWWSVRRNWIVGTRDLPADLLLVLPAVEPEEAA